MNPLLALHAKAGAEARAKALSPRRRSAIARRAALARWRKRPRPEPYWETMVKTFDPLNREFHLTLDVAASAENAKCSRFYTVEDNALMQPWAPERCWCSPPYDEAMLAQFVEKAYNESQRGALVVMLIPARTERWWWHQYIIDGGAEVRFERGRTPFRRRDGKVRTSPVPCAIIVFRPRVTPSD
jgi:phage N-6-adenine-methyltransferase